MNNRSDWGETHRCIVVVQHLSHYRSGVYKELDTESGWKFTFAGGDAVAGSSIPGVDDGLLRDKRTLRNRWFKGGVSWQQGLLSLLFKERFQVAILLGDAKVLSTWIASIWLRLIGTKVFFWTTGWHRPERGLKKWVRKTFYKLSHGLLLYGRDGYEIAVESGLHPDNLYIVGNSHDMANDLDQIADRTPKSPRANQTVGAVVRLQEVKRLDLLLRAVKIIEDRGNGPIRVALVGDGPARQGLEELARELDVNVTFYGPTYDREVIRTFYEGISLTVVPEYAGLTVIQSLVHGIPAVTVDDPHTQAPEYRAIIPGVTGDLYTKGDIHSLAESIERWVSRFETSADEIMKACQTEVASNWTPAVHAKRILRVITKYSS